MNKNDTRVSIENGSFGVIANELNMDTKHKDISGTACSAGLTKPTADKPKK